MKIILAGFNLDVNTIEDYKNFIQRVVKELNINTFSKLDSQTKEQIIKEIYQNAYSLSEKENLTPETLSAAYARISRNSKPVNELREIARHEIDRARKSNQNIIFNLGHSSVAEHATFNFDIIDVSRYAVEIIQHFRLASYTEKSQRYVLFKDDFVIPKEIQNTLFEKEYIRLIREQNNIYQTLYEVLHPYMFELYPKLAENQKNHRMLEGLAKEDARYVISLATQTQLGMTVNARTLENIIVKSNSHPLAEINEYGKKLYEVTKGYTPSIVKYIKPTEYLKNKNEDLKKVSFKKMRISRKFENNNDIQLIGYHPKNAEDRLLAIILFHHNGLNYSQSLKKVMQLNHDEKKSIFREIFRNINSWDNVIREFEFIYFTFQLTVSASNYGQLKRHRMVNIISQEYDIDLGVTIPNSVIETNKKDLFLKIIYKTNRLYQKLKDFSPIIAPYILTNAHRRRVLLKINMRELYHFSRLREDQHAQWDIRVTAHKISNIVREKLPLAGALLCGKDEFNKIYEQFFQD